MEQIKITVRIICLAALGIGIINSFTSSKDRSKSINFITGLIFLLLVINPIIKSDYNFDADLIDYSVAENEAQLNLNDEVLSLTEKKIVEILENELKDRGIGIESMEVECTKSEDNSVSISKIECTVSKSEDIKRAESVLKERTDNSGCLTVVSKQN